LDVSRDITRRMQLEEELRHTQKMKAVATLSGGVAHEFNNLLMGIQGNVSLILAGMDEHDPKYHKLKNIEKCVSRGADLTKKLLGISSRKKNRTEKTNINELLQKTVTEKNIHIRQKYAHNLWKVDAEPQQISQVLSDILLNAWKTTNGREDLCLETENVVLNSGNSRSVRLKNGRYVKISVADTDEIPFRHQMYDSFFAVKDMGNGSGLTLASAYSIVDDHGGAMYVYNEKGKGSMFEILLPCNEL
jgi:two-component system, cell cycle sensor histidine kinase and response regulator CckA